MPRRVIALIFVALVGGGLSACGSDEKGRAKRTTSTSTVFGINCQSGVDCPGD